MSSNPNLRQFVVCGLLSLLLLLAAHPNLKAIQSLPPILNPKTYTSPSGEFVLHVNPSDREGKGAATYRLTRKGVVAWSGVRPFTLWDAGVTDDGTVAGYAYTYGFQGWGGKVASDFGEFEVSIFDPSGRARLDKKFKREFSRFLHDPPNPIAVGLIVDGANDRMIVRVADPDVNRHEEVWRHYQLSTGIELRQYIPLRLMGSDSSAFSIIDAKSVAGTPFDLLHWWHYGGSSALGGRFTLIDLEGKPVWTLDLPQDYNVPGDDREQDRLMYEIRSKGALLRTDQSGKFTLRFVALKQQVTFKIAADGSAKLRVTEVGREPYIAPDKAGVTFTALEIRLKQRDKIALSTPGRQTQPLIRHVTDLVSAGPNRFAFLRRDGTTELVVVSDRGKVIQTASLNKIPLKGNDTVSKLLWRNGTQFLVFVERHTESVQFEDLYCEAYQVDARTRATIKLVGFRCPYLKSVAQTSSGGFVVLATVHAKYTAKEEVYAYDSWGRRSWALTRDYGFGPHEGPDALFSPESLAVLSDGSVALLDVIRHTVQLYTGRGHYTKTLSLDKAWGRPASYPSDILADTKGGFVVHDFMGTPPLFWMNTRGSVIRRLTYRYADGTQMENPDLVIAANGSLWGSDTYSILRLNEEGKAVRRLGEAPRPDLLREIAELVVSPDGNIYAADRRTNAVHVFDARGHWLFVCKTRKKVSEMLSIFRSMTNEIALAPKGVFAIDEEWFGPDGSRRTKPTGFRSISMRVNSIQRRPNDSWLERPSASAAGSDGTLTLVDGGGPFDGEHDVYLSIYGANDSPLRMIQLPDSIGAFPSLATDGKVAILVGNGRVYCYGITGEPRWRFSLHHEKAAEKAWRPFLTESGKTLCLFDGERTIYRYAMP